MMKIANRITTRLVFPTTSLNQNNMFDAFKRTGATNPTFTLGNGQRPFYIESVEVEAWIQSGANYVMSANVISVGVVNLVDNAPLITEQPIAVSGILTSSKFNRAIFNHGDWKLSSPLVCQGGFSVESLVLQFTNFSPSGSPYVIYSNINFVGYVEN